MTDQVCRHCGVRIGPAFPGLFIGLDEAGSTYCDPVDDSGNEQFHEPCQP